jgi:ATP-dependent helicase HrpB
LSSRALANRLPIDDQLEAIRAALAPGATVVLQAPPGAGKTTRVPLALLEAFGAEGRILLIEPRRLATRAAAERLAAGLLEPVGERVGYSVRLERRCSARTRLEALTGGLFLRRLQADPALEGVACVIFDEFHERGAEADLALALVRQARSLLRPELRLLVMSATLDLEPLAAGLDGATVITSPGRSYPVAVEHQRPRERERLEHQVIRALESHWLEACGPGETVLVFLPGQREISDAQRAIEATSWGRELPCTPLHGQLSLADQGKAIAPAATAAGQVVLATSIAESSLTIAGVTLVIDAGLSRRNRFDPATGLDRLVTLPASLASAEQRRGRAGRAGLRAVSGSSWCALERDCARSAACAIRFDPGGSGGPRAGGFAWQLPVARAHRDAACGRPDRPRRGLDLRASGPHPDRRRRIGRTGTRPGHALWRAARFAAAGGRTAPLGKPAHRARERRSHRADHPCRGRCR